MTAEDVETNNVDGHRARRSSAEARYAYDIAVAAHHAVEPEARIIADLDVSDDLSAFGEKNTPTDFRFLPLVLVQHRGLWLKATTLAVFGDIINGCFGSSS